MCLLWYLDIQGMVNGKYSGQNIILDISVIEVKESMYEKEAPA